MNDIKVRLEELRAELRAERISYGELAELQGLAEHIDPSDTELLEAAGVPEHPDEKKTITITVQYDVTETAYDGEYGRAETLRAALVEKFTHAEGCVMEDYGEPESGEEIWGGYDGAYITAARILDDEPKTPVVVVVRDPDASNDFREFGSTDVITYDIDAGKMDLRDPEEYAEWAQSHRESADDFEAKGYPDVAAYIRSTVEGYDVGH